MFPTYKILQLFPCGVDIMYEFSINVAVNPHLQGKILGPKLATKKRNKFVHPTTYFDNFSCHPTKDTHKVILYISIQPCSSVGSNKI